MMGSAGGPTGVYARAATLGAVAGLRSQMPLALLALAANRGSFAAGAARPAGLLRSRRAVIGSVLAAAGELVGDKLPSTPSRLGPGPLAARLVLGGLAGAAVAQDARLSPLAGGALGASAAGGGAAAGYYGRAYLGRVTGVPDPVWGGVEDLLALSLGFAAVRRYLGS